MQVAQAIERNEAIMFQGRPLVIGTFVRLDGALGILTIERGVPRAFGRNLDGQPLAAVGTDKVLAGEWFYPGSAGYDACITDAAQIEDLVNAGGTEWNIFNKLVPEVAQRRKVESLATYKVYSTTLPQPHFPHIIPPEDAQTSEVKRRIFEAQKSVIRSFITDPAASGSHATKCTIPSTLDVVTSLSPTYPGTIADDLLTYAKANSLKLVNSDVGSIYGWIAGTLDEEVPLVDFAAALDGAGSADDLRRMASEFVVSRATWFEWGSVNNDPSPYYPASWKTELLNRAAAILKKQAEDSGQPAPVPPPPEWVAISSDYGFRDVCDIRKFAEGMGEKAAWVSKFGAKSYDAETAKNKPNAPANTWVIRRTVFDAIRAKYPASIAKYSVRIAA